MKISKFPKFQIFVFFDFFLENLIFPEKKSQNNFRFFLRIFLVPKQKYIFRKNIFLTQNCPRIAKIVLRNPCDEFIDAKTTKIRTTLQNFKFQCRPGTLNPLHFLEGPCGKSPDLENFLNLRAEFSGTVLKNRSPPHREICSMICVV